MHAELGRELRQKKVQIQRMMQSGEQSGLADNSTQTEIAGHAEMNDEALMDITDNDMEVADDSEDESESTTVSKRTSKIENKVEKTLLAENVTDFRVDVSKAASERIVRFQFTAKCEWKRNDNCSCSKSSQSDSGI